jgi:phenylalanyl-tRNA synthetase beta chain
VLKIEKHPHADRLSVCEVRSGADLVTVVCGAKNMKVGDKVVLALPGAVLPNGVTLKETLIRKVKSYGMLCSETELGLSDTSEGIMILPHETPEGILLSKALSLDDAILEVNVTPNRGDCLSMAGLAREVAGNYHLRFKPKSVDLKERKPKGDTVQVADEATDLCNRYTCRVIRGVQVGPSPQHIKQRLESCGIRSINNVVDATNYVMLETGQPLHAFDLSRIREGRIVIRRARAGETMKSLDGVERVLESGDLVIADGARVLALAGVMGGEDSGVEGSTVDLLLESACFSPIAVRRTAKRLALQTESSYRFERNVDPNGCAQALDRLTEIILTLAGGKSVGEIVDVYPKSFSPQKVVLRSARVKKILGVELKPEDILGPLQGLGIEGEKKGEGEFIFKVPTFRSDLSREIDLIEEVARLFGYNRIPVAYPSLSLSELFVPSDHELGRMDEIRRLLVGWGFSEVIHYSFTSPKLLDRFGLSSAAGQALVNPISEAMSVMRPSLVPQMVQTIQGNVFKGNKNLRLFEIRPVYLESLGGTPPFKETWRLCLGLIGSLSPHYFLESGDGGRGADEKASLAEGSAGTLLELKGYVTELVSRQRPDINLIENTLNYKYLHPKQQFSLEVKNGAEGGPAGVGVAAPLGSLGNIHPRLLEELDIPLPVSVAEINLDLFLTGRKNSIQFQEISPFPTVWRDLNLIVTEATPHGRVLEVIHSHGGTWVRRVELLDIYRGPPLKEGNKALTYRIEYGAGERTLTDEEVNEAREGLLKKLNQEVGATLR